MKKIYLKEAAPIFAFILATGILTGCGKDNEEIQAEVPTTIFSEESSIGEESTPDYYSYENSEEMQKEIESQKEYSPMSDEELATFEPTPELYDENEVHVRIYFTNTETIVSNEGLSIKAIETLSTEVQTYLDRVGYTDATELKIVKGSEEKTESTYSFEFLMDEHPETVIKVTWYYEMSQYGFTETKSLKEK